MQIVSPNLPQGRVKRVAYGAFYAPKLQKPLEMLGISSVLLPDNPLVDERLRGHADLSLCALGNGTFIVTQSVLSHSEFKNKANILLNSSPQSAVYPLDAGLNAAVFGKTALHRLDITDERLKAELKTLGFKLINVRQGYTKCSVCILDETHIITQDAGIAAAAQENGIEALLIRAGGIILNGFGEGFVGGAAFKLSADTVAFTGSLEMHPDAAEIHSYICALGMKSVYITDEPCFDVGSVIPLEEF